MKVPAGFFGVNGQSLRLLAGGPQRRLLDRHLAAIERGGIAFVRAPFDWSQVEPAAPRDGGPRYDFRQTDAWMGALARHHLAWYMNAVGIPTPRWAAGPGAANACGYRARPRRLDAFVALVATMASRYGAGGSFWKSHPGLPYDPVRSFEIWNEANFGSFWCPAPQPARFARLLLLSASAIDGVDPGARVVLGGLAGFESGGRGPRGYAHVSLPSFIARVIAAEPGLRRRIDAVAIHSYEPTPAAVLDDLAADRRAVDAAGLAGAPIDLNETGWHTRGAGGTPAVPERRRAAYLARLTRAVAGAGCGVASFAPFAWTTPESNPFHSTDWYGIASPASARPYRSGRAYLDAIASVARSGEAADRGLCGGGGTASTRR